MLETLCPFSPLNNSALSSFQLVTFKSLPRVEDRLLAITSALNKSVVCISNVVTVSPNEKISWDVESVVNNQDLLRDATPKS